MSAFGARRRGGAPDFFGGARVLGPWFFVGEVNTPLGLI